MPSEKIELPEIELPKLPPCAGFDEYGTNQQYSTQQMHEYAVEYAEKFAAAYALLAVKQEREKAAKPFNWQQAGNIKPTGEVDVFGPWKGYAQRTEKMLALWVHLPTDDVVS